jgi:hypothetical protein
MLTTPTYLTSTVESPNHPGMDRRRFLRTNRTRRGQPAECDDTEPVSYFLIGSRGALSVRSDLPSRSLSFTGELEGARGLPTGATS